MAPSWRWTLVRSASAYGGVSSKARRLDSSASLRNRCDCSRSARVAQADREQSHRFLNEALESSLRALELTPPYALADLTSVHRQLGAIYREAGDAERALAHYQR